MSKRLVTCSGAASVMIHKILDVIPNNACFRMTGFNGEDHVRLQHRFIVARKPRQLVDLRADAVSAKVFVERNAQVQHSPVRVQVISQAATPGRILSILPSWTIESLEKASR